MDATSTGTAAPAPSAPSTSSGPFGSSGAPESSSQASNLGGPFANTGAPETSDNETTTDAEKEAKRTYKYRKVTEQGYADEDWDEERVQSFLSDDWEDEYLIDGEKVKIPRHQAHVLVRQGKTGMKRMQDAKKLAEQVEAQRSAALKDPYGWIDESSGYEFDPEASINGMKITKAQRMALDTVSELYRIADLKGKDPDRYVEALRERDQKMQTVRDRMTTKQREAQEAQQRDQAKVQQLRPQVIDALRAVGVEPSQEFESRVITQLRKAAAVGYQMPLTEAAKIARHEYTQETRSTLNKYDGATLLQLLGPDVIKKIREAEVKRIEGVKTAPEQKQESAQTQADASKRNVGRKLHTIYR